MPTYEYRCTECDHAFEARQAFTDDAIEVCPTCGGRVRKLFGNVGIVFKGSGFYKTDSRDKKTAVSTADSGGSASEPPRQWSFWAPERPTLACTMPITTFPTR